MPITPVRGLDSVGWISDEPSVLLPPNAWSDCLNVRFHDGAVAKMPGHERLFTATSATAARNLVYWPRPVTPYYILLSTSAPRRIAADGTIASITRAGANYDSLAIWEATLYNGGYTVVLNNGVDIPQYITYGTSGQVQETMLQDLPDWPTATAAAVVRSAGYALIAGNLTDSSGATTNFHPGRILVSSQAAPGGIPASWTIGPELLTTADQFDLSQTSDVREFIELRGTVLAFTGRSIHRITLATPRNPTRVETLNTGRGILATNCAIEIDGSVFVVGEDDIYTTGGTGAINSVADRKVRDYFFSNLDRSGIDRVQVVRNISQDEVWICYPTISGSSRFFQDEALIWNYKHNTWTRRELPGTSVGVTTGPRVDNNTFTSNINNVIIGGTRPMVADRTNQFDGDNFTAYVERHSLDMGDLEATKWNSSIYPLVDGTGTVDFVASAGNTYRTDTDLTTNPDYSGTFRIGDDYKLDTRVNGRFINIRFESNDNNRWRLAGFSLNTDTNDRR